MKILKQATHGYVPAVDIWTNVSANIHVLVTDIYLPREATDSDLDNLRFALKEWAKLCKFGELAEIGGEKE